jgi:phosphoribosyl-dephospho-CoA transferase
MQSRAVPPFDAVGGSSCDARWRAHDLLRIARFTADAQAPDWLPAAFARAPFAVVRRASVADGFVAVGLRGATRSQRFGTSVAIADIEATFSPEHLAADEPPNERSALPAFRALALLRDLRSALHDFAWGPTGSTGFELATHSQTVTESSDLDLLIRTPERCNPATIRALADALANAAARAGTRVDAQLETPAGGVALAELAAGRSRVLARAADGARLVADPWQA